MGSQVPAPAGVQRTLGAWHAEHPHSGEMLSRNASPARALRFLGIQKWSEGELETAIRLLSAAANLEPGFAAIWSDLGGAYYAQSRLEDARTCLLKSLGLDSVQPSAWLLLGTIYSQEQNDGGAESAYLSALGLDPRLAAAYAGVGLLYFRQRRFREAADRLDAAVKVGNQVPLVHACLGQALHFLGEFSKAADVFAAEAHQHPDDPKIVKRYGLNRFIAVLLQEGIEAALATYGRIAGPHAEDRMTVTRTAFHLLSSFGHREAALELGRARLSWAPGDPVQTYLMDALAQEPLTRAPANYIAGYFDPFAETFDAQLVDVLGYHTPADLGHLLAKTGRTFGKALDLGCGTGLSGPVLKPLAERLTGIDLSPKMLEKAAARGVYGRLIEDDIEAFLNGSPGRFDLVFAADVLIYFGDLGPVMRGVAQALKPGGLFAFSIEYAQQGGYVLQPSGRFAHSSGYIEELAAEEFAVLEQVPKAIRLEACRPVEGMLYVLERR